MYEQSGTHEHEPLSLVSFHSRLNKPALLSSIGKKVGRSLPPKFGENGKVLKVDHAVENIIS